MIYLCCLRFLRDLKKWSWLGKIGKNGQKWGKMAAPESPFIHYYYLISKWSIKYYTWWWLHFHVDIQFNDFENIYYRDRNEFPLIFFFCKMHSDETIGGLNYDDGMIKVKEEPKKSIEKYYCHMVFTKPFKINIRIDPWYTDEECREIDIDKESVASSGSIEID